MCIADKDGKKLFENCGCSYPAATDCKYCVKPSEIKWLTFDGWGKLMLFFFAFATVFCMACIPYFWNTSLFICCVVFILGCAFCSLFHLFLQDYRGSKKGFQVKIFLDEKGFLHCHGANEKFGGYSTGFEVTGSGNTETKSIPIKLWKDAYCFDGNTLLEIHYGEIPSKKGLSKIYNQAMRPDRKENLFSPYYLDIKSVARDWRLAMEDRVGNLCWLYPGESVRFLYNGFHITDKFNKLVIESSENTRVNQELSERIRRTEALLINSLKNRQRDLVELYLSEMEKKRPSLFARDTAGMTADFTIAVLNALSRGLKSNLNLEYLKEISGKLSDESYKNMGIPNPKNTAVV